MTKQIILSIVIASVVSTFVSVGAMQLVGDDQLALGGSRFPNGLSADGTSPVAGQVRGTTLNVTGDATIADDLILSASTFCIDFFATSTATQRRMVASSTATIEGVDGVIMAEYGSCQ